MTVEVFYNTSDLHPYDLTGVLVSKNTWCGLVNRKPLWRCAVPNYIIELYKGNDRTLQIYVKDEDYNIFDLTGATCFFTMKWAKADAVALILKSTAIPAQGRIVAPNKGEVCFYLVPADTSALAAQQYVFDVKVVSASGKVYTVLEGLINLLDKVG